MKVEGFELVRRLGVGTYGEVFQARDLTSGQIVALKVLRRSEGDSLYRFKQEFRALADLSHPNLLRLYDLYERDGVWFFTMEYIDGVDFLTWLRGRSAQGDETTLEPDSPMPLRTVLDSPRAPVDADKLRDGLRQLVAGLDVLHRHGHLHRDLKPANVLVDGNGRIVILDFGLLTDSNDAADVAIVAGTPGYISPEQAAGARATEKSDLFAIGAMLHHALVGQLPGPHCAPVSFDPWIPRDLVELMNALLAHEPQRRPSAERVLDKLDPERARTDHLAFVGRETELAALADALHELSEHRTVHAWVSGMSGIGKSALLQWFLRPLRALPDTVVLVGRCYEQESVPFKGLDSIVDAVTAYLRGLPVARATGLLPRDAHDLVRVFPTFERVEAIRFIPERAFKADHPHEVRRRAVGALKELLTRLGDSARLIVCLDDLQWADLDALRFLAELLTPTEPPTMLFIASFRNGAGTAATLRGMLEPKAGESCVVRTIDLPLGPLSAHDAEALAATVAPAADRAKVIAAASEGHPLFLVELAGHLDGDATTLERLVEHRITKLQPAARQILELIAVAARPVEMALLVDLVGPAAVGPEILRTLRDEHLLRTEGQSSSSGMVIYHDRIRDAIVHTLDPSSLRDRHRTLAETLARDADLAPDTAHHFAEAGEPRIAADYARSAGEHAERTLALDRASALYAKAVDLLREAGEIPPFDLVQRCGDAALHAGHYERAAECFSSCLTTADPALAIELHRKLAELEYRRGRAGTGTALLEDALRRSGIAVPRSPAGFAGATIWQFLRLGWILATGSLVRAARRERRDHDKEASVMAFLRLSEALTWRNVPRAKYFAARGIAIAAGLGKSPALVRALATAGAVLSYRGDRPRSRRYLEQAHVLAGSLDAVAEHAWAWLLRSIAEARAGRPRESRDAARIAVTTLEASTAPELARLRNAWALWSEAELALGNLDEGERIARRLREYEPDVVNYRGQGWALYCLGQVSARRGDLESAKQRFMAAMRDADHADNPQYWAMAASRLIITLIRDGSVDEARAVAEQIMARFSKVIEQPYCVAHGAILVALAASKRAGGTGLAHTARRVAAQGRRYAHKLVATRPGLLAGIAAWDAAMLRTSTARSGFVRALEVAEAQELRGEAIDIRALADVFAIPTV